MIPHRSSSSTTSANIILNSDGPMLLRTGPYEAAMATNLVQHESHPKVPLIFSVDFERGPSMRLTSIEASPQPMAFGATHNPAYVEQFANRAFVFLRRISADGGEGQTHSC